MIGVEHFKDDYQTSYEVILDFSGLMLVFRIVFISLWGCSKVLSRLRFVFNRFEGFFFTSF
jgi:hypothetical protein